MKPFLILLSFAFVHSTFRVTINGVTDTIYSPQIARNVGGSLTESPVTGELVVFDGNPCSIPSEIIPSLRNKIVLISKGPQCKWETMYTNFQSAFVLGTVSRYQDDGPASIHLGNGALFQPPDNKMFQLTIGFEKYDKITNIISTNKSQIITATIFADENQWNSVRMTIAYQIFMRSTISLFLFIAGIQAGVYLYVHISNFGGDFSKFGIPHVVLVIELFGCFFLGFVIVLGGWGTTDIIPDFIQSYFTSVLSGWCIACDLLAASFWRAQVIRLNTSSSKRSFLDRFQAKFPRGSHWMFMFFVILPIIVDTILSMFIVLHWQLEYQTIIAILFAFTIGLQFIVSLHFLFQSIQFHRSVSSLQKKFENSPRKLEMIKILNRLSTVNFYFALSLILYVISLPLGLTRFIYQFESYAWIWGIGLNARGLTSICRVNMFRPNMKGWSKMALSSGSKTVNEGSSVANNNAPFRHISVVSNILATSRGDSHRQS